MEMVELFVPEVVGVFFLLQNSDSFKHFLGPYHFFVKSIGKRLMKAFSKVKAFAYSFIILTSIEIESEKLK